MLLPKVLLFSLLAVLPLQTATPAKQVVNDQLFEAVRKGDAAEVTAALEKGADVNAKFRYGTTALFKAAERGNAEVVRILLDRGADVKVKDTFYGATAMTWALQNDHYEVVKLLLQKGSDGAEDALMAGTRAGNVELVKVALESGKVTPETKTLALVVASENEKGAPIVAILKEAGTLPPLEIDAATLQSYTGKFRGEPGPELLITMKDGHLYAALGREQQRLLPLAKNIFRPLAFGGITLTFNAEGDAVPSLTYKQGQNTMQLKRVE